jgi:lysophospholipase L1-like esterase
MFAGDTVYFDSVCFAEGEDGVISDGVLLYTPTEIISVCSADLKTTYVEGVDYIIEGNRIIRTENSRIPVFYYRDYCKPYADDPATGWIRIVGSDMELILGNKALECQIFVSYRHEGTWEGTTATSQLSYMPNINRKLSSQDPINIVFFGDSITCGWDASGLNEEVVQWQDNTLIHASLNRAPYMPSWAEMVTARLRQTYGYDEITKINRASGGSGTYWGKTAADMWINSSNPDLVIIVFGMNQPHSSKQEFMFDIKSIIATVHAEHPKAEFLLVSCMMPNKASVNFARHKLADQEAALYELQEALAKEGIGVGVVPVHSVFASMEAIGKKYVDYTSNNINHPNDFAARIYAQLILEALEG